MVSLEKMGISDDAGDSDFTVENYTNSRNKSR